MANIYKSENKRSKTVMDHVKKKIGRPKLRWSDVIRKDTKETGIKIEQAQNRRTWRLKT